MTMFLLMSSHNFAAEKSKAEQTLDVEWEYLQNRADVRQVLESPPEASGQPCWDQNIGRMVYLTESSVMFLDKLPTPLERLVAKRGAANDLLDLAAAWNARGCPFMARQTYIDVVEHFPEPIFEAFRIRARIGIDDIRTATKGAVLDKGPKRITFDSPMQFKKLKP